MENSENLKKLSKIADLLDELNWTKLETLRQKARFEYVKKNKTIDEILDIYSKIIESEDKLEKIIFRGISYNIEILNNVREQCKEENITFRIKMREENYKNISNQSTKINKDNLTILKKGIEVEKKIYEIMYNS